MCGEEGVIHLNFVLIGNPPTCDRIWFGKYGYCWGSKENILSCCWNSRHSIKTLLVFFMACRAIPMIAIHGVKSIYNYIYIFIFLCPLTRLCVVYVFSFVIPGGSVNKWARNRTRARATSSTRRRKVACSLRRN